MDLNVLLQKSWTPNKIQENGKEGQIIFKLQGGYR